MIEKGKTMNIDKPSSEEAVCAFCGKPSVGMINGKDYCSEHFYTEPIDKYNMTKEQIKAGLWGGDGVFWKRVGGTDDNPSYKLMSAFEIERNMVRMGEKDGMSKAKIHELKQEVRRWLRNAKIK